MLTLSLSITYLFDLTGLTAFAASQHAVAPLRLRAAFSCCNSFGKSNKSNETSSVYFCHAELSKNNIMFLFNALRKSQKFITASAILKTETNANILVALDL